MHKALCVYIPKYFGLVLDTYGSYCIAVDALPLLHSGNKMLYLCHYRRAGAYCVGRTRRSHCLLVL